MESPLSWSAAGAPDPVVAAVALSERSRRRNERRTPHRVPCRVRLIPPGGGLATTLVGQTVNLSANGLAVQVGRAVPEGAWIETLMPSQTGEARYACGKVVHSRQVMTGVFELGIDLAER